MRELKHQLSVALLLILTAAAVISALINFQQQNKYHLPDDGVTWVDRQGAVQALHVVSGSPGDKAGLRARDRLIAMNGQQVREAKEVIQILAGLGPWSKPTYLVHRQGVELKANVIVGERVPEPALYYQYVVGAAYLGIGLFVFFRRGRAYKARHFYVLCLASFVLSTFHYTGKLNNFDKVMYWGNVAAGVLAPTIFLHFCLTFPEPRKWLRGKAGVAALYAPAGLLLAAFTGVASGALRVSVPLIELRWLLDRVWLSFLTLGYLAGGMALTLEYRRTEDPIVRQQLKWLRNGAYFGIVPFACLYVIPYVLGALPAEYMKLAVLCFLLIPLTWAYAIVRYRLMDVDIIFQQGYVYTLATLCVLAIFYGLIFSFGRFEDLSPTAAAVLILLAAFIFQPIRNWIQEQLDRYYFYKDRYDYRRTLIEFARELSSETDLDTMLSSVAEQLARTLSIRHLGFFLSEEDGSFRLKMRVGLQDRGGRPIGPEHPLDLSFLEQGRSQPYLFFEQTRHPLDVQSREWPSSVRQTIADLNLSYYIPCTVRGRTIAYLGVSRTEKGDFLSSEDVELLMTLAGNVGIAIENARLYASLQRKVEQYERLKEFSENIVESINVGILAADLEDRVDSWNTRMEELTGIRRDEALGRRLNDLFPAELAEQFEKVRGASGIHHISKLALRRDALAERAGGRNGNGAHGIQAAAVPRELVLNLAIAPLVSKEGQQIGRLIILDDVTDRHELERQLIQADKLSSMGLLAAGVAHEVNTPLAVISTYAQMLARQLSGDEQKSKLLDKIARQTFRASEIVNSLLNFSRTSTTAFDEVDLNRVIRDTLPLVEHQIKEAGVQVQLNLEERLPPIKGNPGKLQQVFLNLFLNARDAMPAGGALEIRSWNSGHGVRIDVADTGHGIQPENLHRIFDPFFTTKPGRKGTGLGLSVTYGIVREHGGSIDVDSRPGAGSRFQLEFPAARKAVNA